MKNVVKGFVFILTFILFCIYFPHEVYAIQEYNPQHEEIAEQVNDMLEEYDISYKYEDMNDISISSLIENIKEMLASRARAPFRILGTIFIIIIFSAFFRNVGETFMQKKTYSNMYNLICVLTSVAVIVPMVIESYNHAVFAIENGSNFMKLYVPVYAAITAASGNITSAGIYNAITLVAAELIVDFSDGFLIPLLTVTIALSISGSVFTSSSVDNIIKLIKKLITWSITVVVTLFSGFISLKCTLGARTDTFTSKTAKFVISGFVPIIGSAVSDAYATVKGGFDVMRCTIGLAGTVAIVMIILPPVIELLLYRVVMWIATAIAEMFSSDSLAKLMKNLDNGLSIAMSVLISFSVLFIVCSGILMKTMG